MADNVQLQNSGQIAPLDEIIRLKEKYRFRVILDESNSFGVLGSSGRGLTEHCGVPVCSVLFSRTPSYSLHAFHVVMVLPFCRLRRLIS